MVDRVSNKWHSAFVSWLFKPSWATTPYSYSSSASRNWPNTRSIPSGLHDWKGRIKRMEAATTVLSGSLSGFKQSVGNFNWSYEYRTDEQGVYDWRKQFHSTTGQPHQSYFPFKPDYSALTTGNAARRASSGFIRKVNDLNTAFQGGVFAGELRETLRMLRNPAKAIFDALSRDYIKKNRDYYRKYVKGETRKRERRRALKEWSKVLADSYLEVVFGLKPFLMDAADAYEALSRLTTDSGHHEVIISAFSEIVPVYNTTSSVTYSGAQGGSYPWEGKVQGFQKQKFKIRGLYHRETERPDGLYSRRLAAQQFGLTLDQFVPTVWELLPWSFVVDYFTNVSEVLEYHYFTGANVKWVVNTQIDESQRFVYWGPNIAALRTTYGSFPYRGLSIDVGNPSVEVSWQRKFYRTWGTIPPVTLALSIPGSAQPWCNMAALLASASFHSPQRVKKDVNLRDLF